MELFGLGHGPTFEKIVEYLKSFGPYFVITDADASAVLLREREWRIPDRQNPSLDVSLMRLLGRNWDGRTEMSVGILIETMEREDGSFQEIKNLHATHKTNLKAIFDKQRELYRKDGQVKRALDEAKYQYVPPDFMTEKIRLELVRKSVQTNEIFTFSDALDFEHAVVSISYCSHVVLDKKWARRCRDANLPKESAVVFDGTEIDKLIIALDSERHVKRDRS